MNIKIRLPVLGLGLLALGFIALIAYLCWEPREPSYQGKTMSLWLEDLKPVWRRISAPVTPPTPGMRPGPNVNMFEGGGPEPEVIARSQKAKEAFREMGASAVPPLVRALGRPHPTLDRLWRYLETRSPRFARRLRLSRMEAMSRRTAVMQALVAVGPTGRIAVPALLEWLKTEDGHFPVFMDMELFRPEDGPALMALLNYPQARASALLLLGNLRPKGFSPDPALLRLIDDPDDEVRRRAFLVLGGLGASARPAVPRLLEAGRNTNFGVRYQAVRALGAIGEGAVEAVPALREWSRDTNSFIRLASKDALKKIIPNEVAASGPTNPPAAAAHARDPENP